MAHFPALAKMDNVRVKYACDIIKEKAEKIKEQVDELVQELMAAKSAPVVSKRSLKVADINFENEDVNTLMQIQARLARVILEKSK